MDLNSYIAAEQKQSLSANQVQALHILALTNQELEDFMVNEYLENPMLSLELPRRTDGVAALAYYLFEEATDINIYFGRAVNEAHQGLDIEFGEKLKAVETLEKILSQLGKNVKISMC